MAMLLLQYLVLALSLTLIINLATALKRKPWLWAMLQLACVLISEHLFRIFVPRMPCVLATLIGAIGGFVVLYLVKFTTFKY